MAFPTTSVLDSFTRTNASSLGSNWGTDTIGAGATTFVVTSDRAAARNSSYAEQYWSAGSTFGPDSEAYATTPALATGSFASFGFMVRTQSPGSTAADGYRLTISPGSSEADISRVDNGVETQLGATISQAAAAGDTDGLEAVSSTITAYRKTSAGSWGSIGSRTDTTYSTAGRVGMWAFDPGATGTLDDFGGGTVVSGGTTQTVNPAAIASGATVRAPSLSAKFTLAPSKIAAGASIPAPTVTPGAVTVSPGHVASTAQLFTPSTGGASTVSPALLSESATIYAPAIRATATVAAGHIASGVVVRSATVSPGGVTVSPGLLEEGISVYRPTLTGGSQGETTAAKWVPTLPTIGNRQTGQGAQP